MIFLVDNKGRRIARPWVEPWAMGASGLLHPVVDWVAVDRGETERMLSAVLRAIHARNTAGRGDKVLPTQSQPAIILIFDEAAVILGFGGNPGPGEASNAKLAAMAKEIVMTGRARPRRPGWTTGHMGGISRSDIYEMTLSQARRKAGTDDVVTLFFAAEPDEKIGAPRPRTP